VEERQPFVAEGALAQLGYTPRAIRLSAKEGALPRAENSDLVIHYVALVISRGFQHSHVAIRGRKIEFQEPLPIGRRMCQRSEQASLSISIKNPGPAGME
jgi:hypothetical protein